MSAYTSVAVGIREPSDNPTVDLLGSDHTIPGIEFPTEAGSRVYVALYFDDPAEQAAWLRRLAVSVEELAEQIEQRHGLDSGSDVVRVPVIGRAT